MAFDGIFLAAVREELAALTGSRVDRVFQPEKETIILHLRKDRETKKLLLCSFADQARVHLTNAVFINPSSPPLLCMVLRKHLEGGVLKSVCQPSLERILELHFDTVDELGRQSTRILTIEIMGKHSNIVLINHNGQIIDATRRYTHAVSRHREILPGKPYIKPPDQVKTDPRTLDAESFCNLVLQGNMQTPLEYLLVEKLSGIGPETSKEIVTRAGILPQTSLEVCGEYEFSRLWQSLMDILMSIHPSCWQPEVVLGNDQRPLAFAFYNLQQYQGLSRCYCTSPSSACDSFYSYRRDIRVQEGIKRSLEHVLQRELKRCQKKRVLQANTVAEAEGAHDWRVAGELITANIYRMEKGQTELTAANFYDPEGKEITVELDPSLSPAENARIYFNRYNKARNTARLAREQLRKTNEEISYLESIAQALAIADGMDDLQEIRRELRQSGYIPQTGDKQRKGKKTEKDVDRRPMPLEFISPDNYKILVGKNNRQNDYLTFRLAADDDLWLHAKDIPGSHVIIRTEGREVPPATLEAAARLAARYSRAKQSGRVAVDYTRIKYVRKPAGAKPGMVIYDHHRSVYVVPAE